MLKKTLILSAITLTFIACGSDNSDDKKIPTGESIVTDIEQEMNSSNVSEINDINQTINDSTTNEESDSPDINKTINDINTSQDLDSTVPSLDSTIPNIDLKKGYLIDAPIEGVGYTCGEIEGYTTKTGEFSCSETPVDFTLGSYNLGTLNELTADGMVFPQDLIEGIGRDNFDDKRLTDMITLLQSLDDDGDISEIIKIDPKAIEKFNEFGKATNGLDLNTLINMTGKDSVAVDDAVKHLQNNMLNQEGQNILDSALDTDSLTEEGGVDNLLNNILGGR
jgi:hypothetical protein